MKPNSVDATSRRLKARPQPCDRRQKGNTLVVTLVGLLAIGTFIGLAFNFTHHNARMAQRTQNLNATQAVAEGGLELLYSSWREWVRTHFGSSMPNAEDLEDINAAWPNTDVHPGFEGYTFTQYQISPLDDRGEPAESPAFLTGPSEQMPGILSTTVQYEARSAVSRETLSGDVEVEVRRNVRRSAIPLFQFAIFYELDLEIHPGPGFDVTGRIHTNSGLYAAHSGLTTHGGVTMHGEYVNNFHPLDNRDGTNQQPTFQGGDPETVDRLEPFGEHPDALFDPGDENPNNNGYRELIEPPDPNHPDPPEIAERRYFNQAGLKILIDSRQGASNPLRVLAGGEGMSSAGYPVDSPLYQAVEEALQMGDVIRDGREGELVHLTSLDVNALNAALDLMPRAEDPADGWNGVLYISDLSADGEGGLSPDPDGNLAKKGIRLRNGEELPTGGLTVASDNGVYIQGDYNTGGTGNNVPSNAGNENQPTVPGYNKQPSAVLGDAVMVLSSAWNDANSFNNVSSRNAAPTTVNTAILSGIVASGHGQNNANYSGGAENFPRFLENWTNRRFTYYGSMLQLFESEQFTGAWLYGNPVYTAPRRLWYFDIDFLENAPPGTLEAITYSRGRWSMVHRGETRVEEN